MPQKLPFAPYMIFAWSSPPAVLWFSVHEVLWFSVHEVLWFSVHEDVTIRHHDIRRGNAVPGTAQHDRQ